MAYIAPDTFVCIRGFILCALGNFVGPNFVVRRNMYIFANWQYMLL